MPRIGQSFPQRRAGGGTGAGAALDAAGLCEAAGRCDGLGSCDGLGTCGGVEYGGVVIAMWCRSADAIEPCRRPRDQFRRLRLLHVLARRAYSLVP